jgi:hypothetical protein
VTQHCGRHTALTPAVSYGVSLKPGWTVLLYRLRVVVVVDDVVVVVTQTPGFRC